MAGRDNPYRPQGSRRLKPTEQITMAWNIYRINPLTGNYDEIVNSFSRSVNDTANMLEAIKYAKGEKKLNRYHYTVSNGLCTVFDTRTAKPD
jgi:hypothetical protein